jgi:hypothetical protein
LTHASCTHLAGLPHPTTIFCPAALKEVLAGLWDSIQAAAGHCRGDSPSVFKAILDTPHNALIVTDGLWGQVDGRPYLMSDLVHVGLLAVRPFSRWAADVDAAAFGDERLHVVMAPTPAHLHLWRLHHEQLSRRRY